MYGYGAVLDALVERVRNSYPRQILDNGHRDFGGFVSPGYGCPSADHGSGAHDLAAACAAFLAAGSALEGDGELFDRIIPAIEFQKRRQRPSGRIDLVNYNWDSPPDTAFTVQLFSPIVETARRKAEGGGAKARKVADSLGEYVLTAAKGVIGKGFQTANHRWVVCSALAQATTLFPDLDEEEYVGSILAETVDISEDGQYTERSSGGYDAVCNRSLRYMADYMGRPELLDAVRKNLDLLMHLLHPDGTIFTAQSGRQDRDTRRVPAGVADSFYDMARRDGNGMWAAVADMLFDRGSAAGSVWLLHPFLMNPEYRDDTLEREPIPDDFRKTYPVAGLWRVRRGALSATAAADTMSAFAVRCGEVNLAAVRIAGTYGGTAKFCADEFREAGDGVEMIHHGGNVSVHEYELPLGRPVPCGTFGEARKERESWAPPAMNQVLKVMEVEHGFDLHLRTEGGLDRVPFQIEFCFDAPGEWETDGQVVRAVNGQTAILKSGYGVFRRGSDAIRIGPGEVAHRMWEMRDTQIDMERFRVLITLEAPVDRIIEIRCGTWSPARGGIVNE